MAAAATITKKLVGSLGSPVAPMAPATDLLLEVVYISVSATGDWIECGGASPQTRLVHRPIAAFVSAQSLDGAEAVGHGTGLCAAISGTKVVLAGDNTTLADGCEYWVIIVGYYQ
jgi:hypothetical protein